MSNEEVNRKKRLDSLKEQPWDTKSLIGSFFHGSGERKWQGAVIAEPQPGLYLVETFSFLSGGAHSQHLVPLTEMGEWQFYDIAEQMNYVYKYEVSGRWEREREGKEEERKQEDE